MNNHEINCECEACKIGLEAAMLKQNESLKKYGWVVHFVVDDIEHPFSTNIHTHGLYSFGHKDLQICLSLNPEVAHKILIDIVELIKKGNKFEVNKKYSGIIKDYDILFVESNETGRTVLRIIFPNSDGSFEGGIAAEQLKGIKQNFNFSLN